MRPARLRAHPVSAAGLVWELAGRPDPGKPTVTHHGPCYVCGQPCHGDVAVTTKKALGVNFDHTRAGNRTSGHVCAACMWALSGKPPLSLRMWSGIAATNRHFPPNHPKCAYTGLGDRIHLTNRADAREIAHLLTDPPDGPWCCWIAISGQKHVLPYTAVNHGAGPWAVQVEDAVATSTPDAFALTLAQVIALRQAGFPEQAIQAGHPGTWIDGPERLAAWTTWGVPLSTLAGSPLLQLACLIPTKGTLDDLAARYRHHAPDPAEPTGSVRPGTDRPGRDVPRHDDELRLF